MTAGAVRKIEFEPERYSMERSVKGFTDPAKAQKEVHQAGTRVEADPSEDQTVGNVWWTAKPVCYICQERTLLDFFVVHFCRVDEYHRLDYLAG